MYIDHLIPYELIENKLTSQSPKKGPFWVSGLSLKSQKPQLPPNFKRV